MGNTYYIIRHGQTNWNILGKTQGHGNSNLTENGLKQAESLAISMSNFPIDEIFSSDLGRAVQTAEIINKKFGLDIKKTESLREMGFGEWEGLLIKDIEKKYNKMYNTWINKPHLVEIPGGETLEIVKYKVDNLIKDLNEKYCNKHIVLVTHAITVKVMLLSFLNSGMENIYKIKQNNTALNIVTFRDYGPVIEKVNDTSHIK